MELSHLDAISQYKDLVLQRRVALTNSDWNLEKKLLENRKEFSRKMFLENRAAWSLILKDQLLQDRNEAVCLAAASDLFQYPEYHETARAALKDLSEKNESDIGTEALLMLEILKKKK